MYTMSEISDRLEIHELYAQYVHAIDAGDQATLENVFTPDCILDWSHAGGPKETWATAKNGPMLKNELFPFVFHVCVNIIIEFDPDRNGATVRSKTIHPTGLYNTEGVATLFQVQGVYVDRITRTPNGWRLNKRTWHSAWAAGGLTLAGGIPDMLAAAGVNPPALNTPA